MTTGTRLLTLFSLVVFVSPAVSAQTRDPRTSVRGTAILSGTVVSDDEQMRPVRRVRVTCSSGDAGATAITDDRGRFQFPGLRAGRYTIAATKDAWVPTVYV
jgi:uncharacterized protein (DUF2141 family)